MSDTRTFSDWYGDNKEKYNRRRRERYQKDKQYRNKALRNSQRYRESGPRELDEYGRLKQTKIVKGEEIEVFTITAVADKIGKTAQTIRKWEAKGFIPKPIFRTRVRLYTQHQVNLLIRFSEKFGDVWRDSKKLAELCKQIKSAWRD
jgi:hypothetical protein